MEKQDTETRDLQTKVAILEQRVLELEAENLQQKLELKELREKLYGRKSEKFVTEEGNRNGRASKDLCQAEVEQEAVESTKKRRRYLDLDPLPTDETSDLKPGILPSNLERKIIEIDTKPDDWSEEKYSELQPKITERLVTIPAQIYVEQTIRRVWVHRESGQIAPTPPAPEHIFDRCLVDERVIIWVIIHHFMYHLPYYRLEKMFKAMGVSISRDNMIRWCNNLALLFAPIVTALENEVKKSGVILIDETPFVGKPKRSKQYKRNLYFWPMVAPKTGIVFRWTEYRNNNTAKEVLGEIPAGSSIVCDGLNIYQTCVTDFELHMQLCWAHVRRYFYKAQDSNLELAQKALKQIKGIFNAEGLILKAKLAPKELLTERQAKVKPLVEDFIEWVRDIAELPEVVTNSKLNKACQYLLKRVNQAGLFLENPLLPMHNNDNERESKNFKLGAKNWLFTSSEAGANSITIFYSLIRTAQIHGIHPYYYLLDLCQRINQPGLKNSDLTPQKWKERFFAEAVPEEFR